MTGVLQPCTFTLIERPGNYAWVCSCGTTARKWRTTERAAMRSGKQHARYRATHPVFWPSLGRIKHSRRGLARRMVAHNWYVTSRVRCAARLAHLTSLSIHEAAGVFGVSAGGVWNAWERIYPNEPQPRRDDR